MDIEHTDSLTSQTIKVNDNIRITYNPLNKRETRLIKGLIYKLDKNKPRYKPMDDEHNNIIKSIYDHLITSFINPSQERILKILKDKHNITCYGRIVIQRKIKEFKKLTDTEIQSIVLDM